LLVYSEAALRRAFLARRAAARGPPGHGEWLAAHIPGVEARLLDDDGHATLVNRVPEVNAWLSEHLQRASEPCLKAAPDTTSMTA
jgi:hypothetical protein